ncbi:MAG: hypothetical protein ACI9QL_005369, partial [Candidatus Omnitrophota bacterium]
MRMSQLRNLLLILPFALFCGCGETNSTTNPASKGAAVGHPIHVLSQLDVQRDPAALLKPAPGTPAMVSTFDQAGGNTDWTELKEDQVGPDGLVTLAEFTGPGCVTRIWNTSVGAKEWHFFFDGESEARLVGSTQDFFGGKHPFVAPLAG